MVQRLPVGEKCHMEYCATSKVCTTLFVVHFVSDQISDRFVFKPVNFELWTGKGKSDVQDHVDSKAMVDFDQNIQHAHHTFRRVVNSNDRQELLSGSEGLQVMELNISLFP